MNISGPQHLQLPYEITETYKELFRTVKGTFPHEKLLCSFPVQGSYYNEFSQLSRLTPFDGEDYPANDEEAMRYIEPAVRLMVIGSNKIMQEELSEKTAEEFSLSAGEKICYINLVSHCAIDKNDVPEYPKHIIEKLKPVSSIGDKWFEHIVWYNPFVFEAPNNEVLNKKLQVLQLPLCQKLILSQLEFFYPNHILFMPNAKKFADAFPKDKTFIKQCIKAF